jgi:flagellar biosynthesis/type III secretory pathway M-ring protein FliF/YscJ
MLLGNDYPFLDAMWTIFIFFAWVIFIWLLIMVLSDNFRRSDHSGWAKAGWTLFVIFVPLFGVLIYMITRPRMTEQDKQLIAQAQEQQRRLEGYSAADEIAKLNDLRAQGTISAEEYERLKQKALM